MEKYTIQIVSKITGLNPHTIRAWEKRYKAVVPGRTDSGRRVYSQTDVERLNHIKDLASLGYSLGDLSQLEGGELPKLHKKHFGEVDLSSVRPTMAEAKPNIDPHLALQHLFLALYDYKLDIISHEFGKLIEGLNERQLCLDIMSPLFAEINHQVDSGKISIAQEHALSAIIKFHIGGALYRGYHQRKSSKYRVALATPEGDLHEFGIICASLLCAHYKKEFFYLGCNLPQRSLSEAVTAIGANVLIIGITVNQGFEEDYIDNYIRETIKTVPANTEIWIGGTAKISHREFQKHPRIKLLPTLNLLDNLLANL